MLEHLQSPKKTNTRPAMRPLGALVGFVISSPCGLVVVVVVVVMVVVDVVGIVVLVVMIVVVAMIIVDHAFISVSSRTDMDDDVLDATSMSALDVVEIN